MLTSLYLVQFAFVYVFNLIVGAGALAMPVAFYHAGLVLGSVIVVLLCVARWAPDPVLAFLLVDSFSYVTATFVIESMAAANAWSLGKESKKNKKIKTVQRSPFNVS